MVGVAGFEPKSFAITLWAKPNRVIDFSRGFDNALRKFISKKMVGVAGFEPTTPSPPD